MTVTSIAFYPKGANVDIDYYINKHSPPIWAVLKQYGFSNPRVFAPTDPESPYELVAQGDWPDKESYDRMAKEVSEETQKVWLADLKNYSKQEPIMCVMDSKGLESAWKEE